MTDLLIKLKENDAHLQNFLANGSQRDGTCVGDMTHKMPVCYQICDEWCWATGVSMVSDYYKGQNTCTGFECAVATHEFGQQCCPWSNSCKNTDKDQPSACNKGGQGAQIKDAMGYYTGGSFTQAGSLSQADLDNALSSGRLVLIGVFWTAGGGHLLTVGGCGNGYYYVHDPWGWYGAEGYKQPDAWQGLTYDQVLSYTAPNGGVGKWALSVYWAASAETQHLDALSIAAVARIKNAALVV